jgi:hypothetical protein
MNSETNDDQLWRIAKRRARFKQTCLAYIFVNAFLVAIWYFTSGRGDLYFWPKWPMFGWGIGLAIQYLEAYHGGMIFSAQQEYDSLKRNQKP